MGRVPQQAPGLFCLQEEHREDEGILLHKVWEGFTEALPPVPARSGGSINSSRMQQHFGQRAASGLCFCGRRGGPQLCVHLAAVTLCLWGRTETTRSKQSRSPLLSGNTHAGKPKRSSWVTPGTREEALQMKQCLSPHRRLGFCILERRQAKHPGKKGCGPAERQSKSFLSREEQARDTTQESLGVRGNPTPVQPL